MKPIYKKSIAAMLLLGMSMSANSTIVTQWSFTTDSDFDNSGNNLTFTAGSGSTTGNDHEISWGSATGDFQNPTNSSSGNRSAITIGAVNDNGNTVVTTTTGGGSASGFINTSFDGNPSFGDGEIGLGNNFTHWNNTISSSFSILTSGVIFNTLSLTPILPAGSSVALPNLTFDFNFLETSNSGPCPGGSPTPCGDLWGFSGTPNLNIPFNYQGTNYFASIVVLDPNLQNTPISFLNDGQCAALGFTTGLSGQRCQGFLTSESAATTVQLGFFVSTTPVNVSEPGVLALFGISLLTMGAMRRKKS